MASIFDDLKQKYFDILKPAQQTLSNVGQQVQSLPQQFQAAGQLMQQGVQSYRPPVIGPGKPIQLAPPSAPPIQINTPRFNSAAYNTLGRVAQFQPTAQNFINYINPIKEGGLASQGADMLLQGGLQSGVNMAGQIPELASFANAAGRVGIKATRDLYKLAPQAGFARLGNPLNQGLKNAYKVASGQKPFATVAQLPKAVIEQTGLPADVVVKNTFFDHLTQSHPEIDPSKLYSFVKTLHFPDEVYQLPEKTKLNFFKKLEDRVVNLVATGQDKTLPRSNVITSILTDLGGSKGGNRGKYLQNIKNTSKKVFSIDSGRADQIPSSDMLSQVPGAGVLPRSSESIGIIPQGLD